MLWSRTAEPEQRVNRWQAVLTVCPATRLVNRLVGAQRRRCITAIVTCACGQEGVSLENRHRMTRKRRTHCPPLMLAPLHLQHVRRYVDGVPNVHPAINCVAKECSLSGELQQNRMHPRALGTHLSTR